MLSIDEIRAKAEALRAGEYDGITVYDHAHDLDALCDEVERLRKETAVLHRALGNAVKYFNCSRCGYAGKCDKRSHENCADVFARRAREETEK